MTAWLEERAAALGDGWRVPHDPTDADRRADLPLKAFTQPIRVGNPAAARLPRTFINCTEKGDDELMAPLWRAGERARAAGWDYRELPTGHIPMETLPAELTALLLDLA